MKIYFKKSFLRSEAVREFVRKSQLDEFKRKILEHLDKLEAQEKKEAREKELKKSFATKKGIKKAGLPVGTIREWSGKKYIKIAPDKWVRKYDKESKGIKMAISALKKKVDACASAEELLQLTLQHKERFRDEKGQMLPFVQELSDYVSKRNSAIVAGKDGHATKLRKEFNAHISPLLDKTIKSKNGVEALFTKVSRKEMRGATDETEKNGFTVEEHFEAANQIKQLFESASLVKWHKDYKGNKNLKIGRFLSEEITLNSGKKARVCITVKRFVNENKNILYSIEVMDKENALAQTRAKGKGKALKQDQPHTDTLPQSTNLGNKENALAKKMDSILYEKTESVRGANSPHEADASTGFSVSQSANGINKKDGKITLSPGLLAIRAKYEMSKTVLGRAKTVVLPDGSKMKCHYRIVEAEAPAASHNEASFAPTEGFPTNAEGKNINDRDYQHDMDAQESVRRIAANFNALALDAPPIVTKDGIVISGNNRTMSSKLAARQGTDKAYVESLHEMADEFGIDAGELKGFEHPRVILEVDAEHEGDYTTEEFAAFNRDTKKTMNNVEKAVKITKTLNGGKIKEIAECLDGFETMGELYQDKKGGVKFVQTLVNAGVILENEKAQYLTSDGLLNDTGKDFVETVLVGSVLNEENIRACDGAGGKSIRKKLVRAILPLIENKGNGKEYSFNTELNEAAAIALEVSKNHEKFGTVKDYLDQLNLFSDKKIDDITARLAEVIHDDTEKAFASRMKNLGAGLRDSAEGTQDIFLGGVESKEALISRFLDIKKAIAAILQQVFGFGESA